MALTAEEGYCTEQSKAEKKATYISKTYEGLD